VSVYGLFSTTDHLVQTVFNATLTVVQGIGEAPRARALVIAVDLRSKRASFETCNGCHCQAGTGARSEPALSGQPQAGRSIAWFLRRLGAARCFSSRVIWVHLILDLRRRRPRAGIPGRV